MTEQRINPALWRAVAAELDRIASAEWYIPSEVSSAISTAVQEMPECPQRRAIEWYTLHPFSNAARKGHRWALRALAGALRAEADGVERYAPSQWQNCMLYHCIGCGVTLVELDVYCPRCGAKQ